VPRRLRIYLVVCLVAFLAAFVVQTAFQFLGATRSHWGGNPGWQREIAFWNLFALVVVVRALTLNQATFAKAVTQGCIVLFFLLGTNHLLAFVAAPSASFHWPPLLLNYVGFVLGVHTLVDRQDHLTSPSQGSDLNLRTGPPASHRHTVMPELEPEISSAEANRQSVLNFYRLGLQEKKPTQAFARFAAPDFIEHKPDVPDPTRDGAAAFLEALVAELPSATWDVIRTVAEGDFVVVHARFIPAPGAPAYAIVDIFRLRAGLIVEHWDVVAGPPASARNPLPRF
jgi:predicted SnoaL-like aldol condensation-catalyzing enzyme